jgi:hypothetical protein
MTGQYSERDGKGGSPGSPPCFLLVARESYMPLVARESYMTPSRTSMHFLQPSGLGLICFLNFHGLLGNLSAVVCTYTYCGMHQQVFLGEGSEW